MNTREKLALRFWSSLVGAIALGVAFGLAAALDARGAEPPATHYPASDLYPEGHVAVQVALPEEQFGLVLGSDDLATWHLVSVLPERTRTASVIIPVHSARRFVRTVSFALAADRDAWLQRPDAPAPLPIDTTISRLSALVEIPPTHETPAAALAAQPTAKAAAAAGNNSAKPRNPRRK